MALGPLQSPANGLLALLRLKARGMLPSVLLEEVRPTLDMEGWYLRSRQQRWPGVPTFNGSTTPDVFRQPTVNPIVVPQNETWFVHNFTINALIPAARLVLNAQLGYFTPPTPTPLPFVLVGQPGGYDNTLGGAAVLDVGWSISATNFWAPPGANFGMYIGRTEIPVQFWISGFVYTPLALQDG